MKGEQSFTVRAYRSVAHTIQDLPDELDLMVEEATDLKEIPGVGNAISDKITEMVTTGSLRYYERLKAEFPEGILRVMRVPGVGPKTTARLWKELGISTLAGLERAAKDGRIAALPRLGGKTADNILRHLRSSRNAG